jgi:hypothetical protein
LRHSPGCGIHGRERLSLLAFIVQIIRGLAFEAHKKTALKGGFLCADGIT